MNKEALENQFSILCNRLKEERNEQGFWSGRLSSSALGVAVAIVAFKVNGDVNDNERILNGLRWLTTNQNADGGFGDTPESESNVSTTLLSYAAIFFCQHETPVYPLSRFERLSGLNCDANLQKINQYLNSQNIELKSDTICKSILKFYGNDYTFSVPILSMLFICKVIDDSSLRHIPQLPFEFTLLPASLYRFFNLQVVSYAIPALVAVGIFIFKNRKRSNFIIHSIRNKSIKKSLTKLENMMPESGGFLEAIPLTAFVCMCLISSDIKNFKVIDKGINFLRNQQRTDGSFPIDTDLSTWVTTLSIKALGSKINQVLDINAIDKLRLHLLNLQYKTKHPFNQAQAGGWGWTNFSGSVPDADDTSGAILALLQLYTGTNKENEAIISGCLWLLSIQNADGGLPTFCKGWGRLPFDSSCADITGHGFGALGGCIEKLKDKIPTDIQKKLTSGATKMLHFLEKNQNADGSWLPLWFGNQLATDKKNPVYGTARVSVYLEDCLQYESISDQHKSLIENMLKRSKNFILNQQNVDGSWGGKLGLAGTIEETSLSMSCLAKTHKTVCESAFYWLQNEYSRNNLKSSPIGLYFAALWYDERLYPLTAYIEAINRCLS